MKKVVSLLIALALCVSCASLALGEGVTLRTASIFAGADAAAPAYAALLAAWQAETGNRVDDTSSASNEIWKANILNDFAAGNEPDVLFYFANTADSKPILSKVVPIHEINEAYPELNLPEAEALREPDGNVYAIAVRSFWEGLFVNADLFEAYGLALPTDVETFERAIAVFQENGIIPIAISLSDIPHYLVEFAILSSGTVVEHQAHPKTPDEIPASWVKGMELIRHLYDIGAFAADVNTTTQDLTSAMFRQKMAAMQVDGSWFANSILEENWDTTLVLPFPAYAEDADPTAIIGGTTMGFYITRRTWEDDTKRDAAVSLLAYLTGEAAKEKLGFSFGGEMLRSAQAIVDTANAHNSLAFPIGDVMDGDVRNYWFGQIPAIANGSADPAEVLADVIERGAF